MSRTTTPWRRAAHELGRVAVDPEGDERRRLAARYHLDALGEQLAAAGGRLGGPLEGPVGPAVERRGEPASAAAGVQPGSKRAAPGAELEAALLVVDCLREVARRGQRQRIRVPSARPPIESGPQSHFWQEKA
jgi:hypothetical protein